MDPNPQDLARWLKMAVDVVAAIRSSDYNAARGMVWEFDNAKEHPDLINGG